MNCLKVVGREEFQNMINGDRNPKDTVEIHTLFKEIMCNSEMEDIIEIDEKSIQKVETKNETKRNLIYKFKDKNGKGYYFKHYSHANYKQIRTIYNAIEGRKIDILPKVYCKYSDKNGFYLIEEEIEGETEGKTIEKYIQEESNSIEEILEIIKKLCKGIEKFHNLLLVHCDLTPWNVIVCKHKGERTVKIIDLECVFMVDAIDGYSRKPMGTEKYIAEEVNNNPSGIDRRTDIFSIGVILKEWIRVTGCLEKYDSNIREKIEVIISRCCDVKQSCRYQNAVELMRALSEIETIIDIDNWLSDYARRNSNISLIRFYGDKKEVLSNLHNDENKNDEVLYLLYDIQNKASIRFSLDSFKYVKGEIVGLDSKKINLIKKQRISLNEDKQMEKYGKTEFSNIIAAGQAKENQLRILKEINKDGEIKLKQDQYSIGIFAVDEITELIAYIVEKRKMFYSARSRIEYYESEFNKIDSYTRNEKRSTKLSYQIFLGEKINSIYEQENIDKELRNNWRKKLGRTYYMLADERENSYRIDKNPKKEKSIVYAYEKAIEYGFEDAEQAKENFIKQNTKNK